MSGYEIKDLFSELFENKTIENKLKENNVLIVIIQIDRVKKLDKQKKENVNFLMENKNRIHLFMTDREFYRCKQIDGSDVELQDPICDPIANIQNCIEIYENLAPLLTTSSKLVQDDLDEVVSLPKLLVKDIHLEKLETEQVKLSQIFQSILDSSNDDSSS